MRSIRSFPWQRLLLVLIMEIGAVVLLFPTIANWFSTLGYHEQSRAYADSLATFDQQQLDRMIDQAREYNRQLPNGPLRDPYILNERGQAEDMRDRIPEYERQLNFGEGLPMAWVDIPSIKTTLPIFHGTADQTLEKGAGHLHGSALPVGGESSHSVITAHSGLTTAKLFSELHKVKIGDVFSTQVGDRSFYYRVNRIVTVEPDSGEYLRQVAGADLVTLVTCTPTGVNSHRLLVTGERIPTPSSNEDVGVKVSDYHPDFPWWIIILLAIGITTWTGLWAVDRKKAARSRIPRHCAEKSAEEKGLPIPIR